MKISHLFGKISQVKMIYTTFLTLWLLTVNLHIVQSTIYGRNVSNLEDGSSWVKTISDSNKFANQFEPRELRNESGNPEITSLTLMYEDQPGEKLKKKCPHCRLKCANLRRDIQNEVKSSVLNASSGLPLPTVKIVSNTDLGEEILLTNLNIKSISVPGNCTLVIFYASWCQWSARAAPSLNAISRAFKNVLFVAVDAYSSSSHDISNYGVYGVPSLMLFHNGRLHTRYNGSDITMDSIAEFLMRHTDQSPTVGMEIKSMDYRGPLPSTPIEVDSSKKWLVMGSWLFIVGSATYCLFRSEVLSSLFLNLWMFVQNLLEDEEFKELKMAESVGSHTSFSKLKDNNNMCS